MVLPVVFIKNKQNSSGTKSNGTENERNGQTNGTVLAEKSKPSILRHFFVSIFFSNKINGLKKTPAFSVTLPK